MSNQKNNNNMETKRNFINNDDNYESINVLLSKDKQSIAFENCVQTFMMSGMTREEAEKYVSTTPIELELYYEVGYGLFGLDSGFVESVSEFSSPYSGEKYVSEENFD